MKLSHITADWLNSLPKLFGTTTTKSAFTGQPLIPADSRNVIDGYRLTEWQASRVRDCNARVLARHVSTGEIVCTSPIAGRFILSAGPVEDYDDDHE